MGLQAQEGLIYPGLVLVEAKVEVGVLGVLLGGEGALSFSHPLRRGNTQLRAQLQPLLIEVVEEVNQGSAGSTGVFEYKFGGGHCCRAREVPGDSRGDKFTNLSGIFLAFFTTINAFFGC